MKREVLRETQANIDAERLIADRLARAWDVDVETFPSQKKVLDSVLMKKGRILGVAEIKERHNAHDKYKTVYIDLSKIRAARQFVLEGLRAFLVFSFHDGLFAHEIDYQKKYLVTKGGNRQLNDPFDVDLVAHIQLSDLKRVEEKADASEKRK